MGVPSGQMGNVIGIEIAFWTFPLRMQAVQTFFRTVLPFSTTRMVWMFGAKVRVVFFTTCIPMPPFFLAKPRRMMCPPWTLCFPQISQTLLMMGSSELY